MITAVVTFNVPKEMTHAKALETFKAASPRFQNVPGLIRKQFLYNCVKHRWRCLSLDARRGGGMFPGVWRATSAYLPSLSHIA